MLTTYAGVVRSGRRMQRSQPGMWPLTYHPPYFTPFHTQHPSPQTNHNNHSDADLAGRDNGHTCSGSMCLRGGGRDVGVSGRVWGGCVWGGCVSASAGGAVLHGSVKIAWSQSCLCCLAKSIDVTMTTGVAKTAQKDLGPG